MKKILTVVAIVLVALVIFGAGLVFARTQVASAAGLALGFGQGGMMGGRGGMMGGGQIHEYVEQALADKLGMTAAELETQLSSGKSMNQVALDKGIAAADVTALLTDVHKTALAKAVTDGLLTQVQADAMLQNMTANGFNYAGGRGGMMGGGQIHEYVEQALADKLGMTVTDLETQLSSGKSMNQVALDKGIAAADVTALLTDVHKTALAKAVSDGLLTQAQADAMLQNMTANGFNDAGGRGGMMGGRGGQGGMMGGRGGQGGMMGGRNQQPAATQAPTTK